MQPPGLSKVGEVRLLAMLASGREVACAKLFQVTARSATRALLPNLNLCSLPLVCFLRTLAHVVPGKW